MGGRDYITGSPIVLEPVNSPALQLFQHKTKMDFFNDFDWRKNADKLLLGGVIFIVGRFLVTLIEEKAKDVYHANHLAIPNSDKEIYRAHIPLPQQGASGVYRTLELMAQLVRRDASSEYLRRVAVDLVRGCPGHDDQCEIKRVFEYARDRITYRRDPTGIERISDARRTIESGVGDCDDKCIVLSSLAAVLGYPSRFVVCGFKRHSFSHVYCEVLTRRGWLALDPTPENAAFGWEQQHAPYREVYEIFR
jgi:hypothetical protein